MGERAARPKDLSWIASAHMVDLHRATGQAVHLALLEGLEVVYIKILKPSTGPPLPSRVGGRMPAYATGVGKALLAQAPKDTLERVIRTGLPRVGPKSIASPTLLRSQLVTIRRAGLAYDREESAANVSCAASPIFDDDGRAVAAVSVSGWSGRLDVRRVGPAVKAAAYGISRLAARPPARH